MENATPSPERQVINVDLDHIYNFAIKGVMRSYYFLSFGVNAARTPEFKNFQYPAFINFVPNARDLSDAESQHVKEHFEIWIVGNALRELIEIFSVYLVKIYGVCQLFSQKKLEGIEPLQAKFERGSFKNKLETLATDFSITSGHLDELLSVQTYRNCLTHRLGIVGAEDVGANQKMVVRWRCMEIFLKTDDGREIAFPTDSLEPFHVEKDSEVCLRFGVLREREFSLGQKADLKPHEISEIGFMFFRAAETIRNSIIKFAEVQGIKVNAKKSPITTN